jgi:hypothetical protein
MTDTLRCSCDGDLPLDPLDCEICNVPICLRCSIQGAALCKLCIDIQIQTLEEKASNYKCMKCDNIPYISNKCAECDKQVKLCKEHMNVCQFDFNIQRNRKCTPRIRCSDHSMKCECHHSCIHCSYYTSTTCHICKFNVCFGCSRIYEGQRVCRCHQRRCDLDRCTMYPLPELKCAVSEEDGQQCIYYSCHSKHYDKICHPTFALKENTYTRLRYEQCKTQTKYCKSHVFRCGVIRGTVTDCLRSEIGCCEIVPLPFSVAMNFRKYRAHCFDFCFDCMGKVREMVDTFLLIIKRNNIYMDKHVIEHIIVYMLDINVKRVGNWQLW